MDGLAGGVADFSWHSLLPPTLAIVLAIVTRKVLLPLAAGVLLGSFLLTADAEGHRVVSTLMHFLRSLSDSVVNVGDQPLTASTIFSASHVQVLLFTLLLGAMVGVLEAGGGMAALLTTVSRRIRTRRQAQTLIGLSGLAIFFDDYANTLLIGGTYRSTADRFGISRAKLAYLVDSTAAPVAGLALVSTWVATEISYLEDGLRSIGSPDADRAFELFIWSIPYRYYPWLALFMVFMVAATGRDFGPMRTAEAEADRGAGPDESGDSGARSGWFDLVIAAVFPVLACVMAVATVLVWTGLSSAGEPFAGGLRRVGQIVGQGDSYLALVVGGMVGLVSAVCGAVWLNGRFSFKIFAGIVRGALQMMPAMFVLWLAWALSAMTEPDQLDTGGYLTGLLSERVDPRWLPTCVFLLAGLVAFSTGTSWGTMAILTPIAVAMAVRLDSVNGAEGVIHLATFGSVLAGAIFGDHCSPLSDTTVLSSRASGCDHMLHVRTQMPYAVCVGLVSVLCGTIPVAFGLPPWISLAAGVGLVVAIVRLVGRTSRSERSSPQAPV